MTKTLIAALALTTASMAAFAESPAASGPLNQTVTAPTMTRGAVVQELMAARATGTLMRAGELGQVPPAFVPEESRAEVRAEVLGRRGPPALGFQPA